MDLLIKCLAADFYVLDLVLLLFSHAFSVLEKWEGKCSKKSYKSQIDRFIESLLLVKIIIIYWNVNNVYLCNCVHKQFLNLRTNSHY